MASLTTTIDPDLLQVLDCLRAASLQIHRDLAAHVGMGVAIQFQDGRPNVVMNASGDKVHAIDELSDLAVEQHLQSCPSVRGFASEERESFVSCHPSEEGGKYIVVFDPLDGSQNLPVGLSVGSIYGIFEASELTDIASGDDMVAAAYSLYSASLQFVSSVKGQQSLTVQQYMFPSSEWVVASPNHTRPDVGKIHCINSGNSGNWLLPVQIFVEQHMKPRSVRWMACMVSDVHRPLMQGGCFLYPSDRKYTKGRLRLVYEAYPMAFLWEAAGGGVALTGARQGRILEVPFPHDDVHVRAGVVLLGKKEAEMFEVACGMADDRMEDWGAF